MNRTVICSIICTAAAVCPASGQGFDGPFSWDRWETARANGDLDGNSFVTKAMQFDYLVENNDGFSIGTTTSLRFGVVADQAETITFSFDWRATHRNSGARRGMRVYADGPGGRVYTDIFAYGSAPSFSFTETGQASVDVEAGYEWGIEVSGSNVNAAANLFGSLVLFNSSREFTGAYDRANWTFDHTPGVAEYTLTTELLDALEMRYDVDLSTSNLMAQNPCNWIFSYAARRYDVMNYAFIDGTATVNWAYDFDHRNSADWAEIQSRNFAGGSAATTSVDTRCDLREIMSGTMDIDVESQQQFGVRVGGANYASNTNIYGSVVLWNMQFTPAAECVADVNTTNTNPGDAGYGSPDGQVDGADLSYYVESWLAGCP